jgi:hypothetical protein
VVGGYVEKYGAPCATVWFAGPAAVVGGYASGLKPQDGEKPTEAHLPLWKWLIANPVSGPMVAAARRTHVIVDAVGARIASFLVAQGSAR